MSTSKPISILSYQGLTVSVGPFDQWWKSMNLYIKGRIFVPSHARNSKRKLQAIIIINGVGADETSFEKLAIKLAKEGYLVLYPMVENLTTIKTIESDHFLPVAGGSGFIHGALSILGTLREMKAGNVLYEGGIEPWSNCDLNEIGLFAYSWGGEVVNALRSIILSLRSPFKIKGVFSVGPTNMTKAVIDVPLLLAYGQDDGNYPCGSPIEYWERAKGGKAIMIIDAGHEIYSSPAYYHVIIPAAVQFFGYIFKDSFPVEIIQEFRKNQYVHEGAWVPFENFNIPIPSGVGETHLGYNPLEYDRQAVKLNEFSAQLGVLYFIDNHPHIEGLENLKPLASKKIADSVEDILISVSSTQLEKFLRNIVGENWRRGGRLELLETTTLEEIKTLLEEVSGTKSNYLRNSGDARKILQHVNKIVIDLPPMIRMLLRDEPYADWVLCFRAACFEKKNVIEKESPTVALHYGAEGYSTTYYFNEIISTGKFEFFEEELDYNALRVIPSFHLRLESENIEQLEKIVIEANSCEFVILDQLYISK